MSDPVHPTVSNDSPAGDVCPPLEQLLPWVDVDLPEPPLDTLSLDPSLSAHLARCEQCQQRLHDSAAPSSW